jgi:hypothetical protein
MIHRGLIGLAASLTVAVSVAQPPTPAPTPTPTLVPQPKQYLVMPSIGALPKLPAAPAAPPALSAPIAPAPLVVSRPVPVNPRLAFDPASNTIVRDLHLRPLFTTTIHVPDAVTSLVVGAPTLFEVEHKDSEPNLIFIKPSTHLAAESNLLIALQSGETLSVRLISPGDNGSSDPTDFVVDFRGRKSLFEPRAVVLGTPGSDSVNASSPGAESGVGSNAVSHTASSVSGSPSLAINADAAIGRELTVGSPHWMTASQLTKYIKANALAPNCIAIAVGEIRQEGENMVVSFSVLNISGHWVNIMPPQIELTNPLLKKRDIKKQGSFAQPVASLEYRLENPKLSPGSRTDGSITFPKPDSKIARESLLLHIATSAAIDTPVYYPLPFVAPSSEEVLTQQEGADARSH